MLHIILFDIVILCLVVTSDSYKLAVKTNNISRRFHNSLVKLASYNFRKYRSSILLAKKKKVSTSKSSEEDGDDDLDYVLPGYINDNDMKTLVFEGSAGLLEGENDMITDDEIGSADIVEEFIVDGDFSGDDKLTSTSGNQSLKPMLASIITDIAHQQNANIEKSLWLPGRLELVVTSKENPDESPSAEMLENIHRAIYEKFEATDEGQHFVINNEVIIFSFIFYYISETIFEVMTPIM